MRWNYYKLRQLSLLQSAMDLQIATTFFLQSATRFITNSDSTLGGNWRSSSSWGYKEYNAITMHTSLSQWHQLAHKIY